ncbi:MAG: aldehyde reductase [Phaeodactylibacter sp.]|nr:aldehyde reductase [Phaeodactylibacter sp.]
MKVLLTGVTGFLGSHTTIQLLNKGYQVVGTLRDKSRAAGIRSVIGKQTDRLDLLSFAEADLSDTSIWKDLMAGIDYVQHIASPFPRLLPKNESELIEPARNGTLAILRAAAEQKVKRVVMTSSIAAVSYGRPTNQRSGNYNETDWTDVSNKKDTTPYFRSKTIAERAAWDFIASDPSGLELATVCPGAILGPVLEKDFGTSANLVIKCMDGSAPALPKLSFEVVDVRSVADLQIRAMENPAAANQRFIATAGLMNYREIADVLRAAHPDRKIPKRILPNFAVRLYSNIEPTIKPMLLELGIQRRLDHSKSVEQLGWTPISPKEAILSCASSIFEQGIIKS